MIYFLDLGRLNNTNFGEIWNTLGSKKKYRQKQVIHFLLQC